MSKKDTLALAERKKSDRSTESVTRSKSIATITTLTRTFLDEVDYSIPYTGGIPATTQRVVDQDGVIIFEGHNRIEIPGRFSVTSARVRTKNRKEMRTQVCVPKFKFGHNVAGYPGLQRSVKAVLQIVGKVVRQTFDEPWQEPEKSGVTVNSVSLVRHLQFATEEEAAGAVNEIQRLCASHGMHILYFKQGETVTASANPRQVTTTFYVKSKEMRSNPTAARHPRIVDLLDAVHGWLRVEVRITPATLRKLGLETADRWKRGTADSVFEQLFAGFSFLSLSPVAATRATAGAELPLPLQRAVSLVRAGESLAANYAPSSVRRLCAQAAEYGLDIRAPVLSPEATLQLLNPAGRWVLDVPDRAKHIPGFDAQYGDPINSDGP